MSAGEKRVRLWLITNSIRFEQEKSFNDCINSYTGALLQFDFYLPDLNILIEFDGLQHSVPVDDFHSTRKDFLKQKARDEIKNKYCRSKNIRLIRISHVDFGSTYRILSGLVLPLINKQTNDINNDNEEHYPFQEAQAVF